MDWTKVDLKDNYERNQTFLDGYSFDTLLLELQCNYPKEKLTKEVVMKHVTSIIENNVAEAFSIINDNLDNIIKTSLDERE